MSSIELLPYDSVGPTIEIDARETSTDSVTWGIAEDGLHVIKVEPKREEETAFALKTSPTNGREVFMHPHGSVSEVGLLALQGAQTPEPVRRKRSSSTK